LIQLQFGTFELISNEKCPRVKERGHACIVGNPDRAPWLNVGWQTTLSQRLPASALFPGLVPPKSLLSSRNMDTDQSTLAHKAHCDVCGQSTSGYDIVHYGSIERGYRQLCSRCFNTQMAKAAGLDEGFEHVKFEPVGLTDCLGELHEFHFRARLFGTGVAIDAFELRNEDPAGYCFQIIGEPEVDLLVLLGQLVEKMRRALLIKHLKDGDCGLQIADGGVVRGRIKWDAAHDGQLPLLVIDGREIDWNRFGRMLMSHEGAQFKLTIADKSEEL
jgi:hypothetical protein